MKLRPREGVMTLVTPGSQATGSTGQPAFHGDRSDWVILTISEVFITAPPFLPTHPPLQGQELRVKVLINKGIRFQLLFS